MLQILQTLSVQGASSGAGDAVSSNANISRSSVKDRFKTFNMLFEEIHQRQSQWTVPDSELRESLRLAVAEVLLPAYRSFAKRYGYAFLDLFNTIFHMNRRTREFSLSKHCLSNSCPLYFL